VSLHEADVIDDYGDAKARAAARLLDTETHWQDVPAADIERHWTLSFLDAEGFRYYAPAYMVWTLRNLGSPVSDSGGSIVYAFLSYLSDEWALFSHEQKQAIAAFLRFIAEDSDGLEDDDSARQALARYWGQFG
jgi:hypothetical protein